MPSNQNNSREGSGNRPTTSAAGTSVGLPTRTVRPCQRRLPGLARRLTYQLVRGPQVNGTTKSAPRSTIRIGVDSVALRVRPGVDPGALARRIRAAVPGVDALTGDDRGRAELPQTDANAIALIALSAAFGGTATAIVIFVVGSTMGLSIQLRRREMALLRAIGTDPGQLRRMVIGETVAIAILALALGYPPSALLGRALLHRFADAGMVPDRLVYHQGWIPAVAGIGVGLLAAVLAALIAARSATRVRPTEALVESLQPRHWLTAWRLVFALLSMSGAIALMLLTLLVIPLPESNATAEPGALLWASGLALLGPGLSRGLIAVLRWPIAALGGMSGQLAMQNARARRIQLAGTITMIMLATGVSTAIIFLNNGQAAQAKQLLAGNLRADAVITGGVPVALADRVATLPGVAGASALVTSSGFFDIPASSNPHYVAPVPLSGITASAAAATTHYDVIAGRLTDLTGNTVALAAGYVQPGRHLGDTVRMRLGDNEVVSLRVVAVFNTPRGAGSALLPAPLLAQHTSFGQADEILVRAAPGVNVATLRSTLTGALTDQPGARVADRAAVLSGFADQQTSVLTVGYLLVAVIIGYTMITLVNTVFAATVKRRREFALQRLIGSTRGQVLRMVGAEAVLVGLAGSVLGTVVDLLTVTRLAPSDWGPLWIYPAIVGGAIGLTLVASLASAGLVLRGRPIADVAGGE